jgi:GntR family transcriptional regulator
MMNDQFERIMGDDDDRPISSRLIANWLRERIESGLLPPGSQLPGVSELATWFAVGPPTASQALNTLAHEGLTELRDDAGIYVRESHVLRRTVTDTCPPEAERSVWQADDDNNVRAQYLPVVDEQAPDPVAHVLGIPASSWVRVRRTRYKWAGRTIQLATTYRPMDEDTEPTPVRFREEVRLRTPHGVEHALLALTPGALVAVVEITRTGYTAQDHPIELSTLILDANSYLLEYHYPAD